MKKIMTRFILGLSVAATVIFTGCTLDETAALSLAKSAGKVAVWTWVAVDNPDTEVKTTVKEIIIKVKEITAATTKVGEYVDTVYPIVEPLIDANEKLKDDQKALAKAGFVIIFTALDEFCANNEKIITAADKASKYINAFFDGASKALGSDTSKIAGKAYKLRAKALK